MDFILVLFLSLDILLVCISYGARHITVPIGSRIVIASVGTACLGASLLLAQLLSLFLSDRLCSLIGCLALFVISLTCIFDEACRRFTEHVVEHCKTFQLKLRNLRFVLEIYAETTRADRDESGSLSPAEALLLALPLSVDALLTGLAIPFSPFKAVALLCFMFLCGICASGAGIFVGKRIGHALGQNAPLLSGLLLFTIALAKLFALTHV